MCLWNGRCGRSLSMAKTPHDAHRIYLFVCVFVCWLACLHIVCLSIFQRRLLANGLVCGWGGGFFGPELAKRLVFGYNG